MIRDLRDDERAWANARYQEIQFAVTPPGSIALVAEVAAVAEAAEVAEPGRARVGLGRLVEHAPEVVELGGIWTDEAARGRGVARAMVTALLDRLARAGRLGDAGDVGRLGDAGDAGRLGDAGGAEPVTLVERANAGPAAGAVTARATPQEVWCIPFAHLAAFYRSFGFVDVPPPWPPPIAAKVADCVVLALPVVVLALPVVVLAR